MTGDNMDLSQEALNELLTLGITAQDIEDMLRQKWTRRLDEHNIINRIPAKEAFDVFFSNAAAATDRRAGLSPSSIEQYKRILLEYYNFCILHGGSEIEVKDIPQYTVPFLTERLEKRNYAIATWNKYAGVLRSFLRTLEDNYDLKLSHLPIIKQDREKLPKALSLLTVKQLIRIAMGAQNGLRALFMVNFFLGTGVRRDEFRLLQRKDVYLSSLHVRIHGKGGK